MIKQIKKFFPCMLVIMLLPMLVSCWSPGQNLFSGITTYHGSRTLANTSYKNLEIHGASTLSNVHVEGFFRCRGAAELFTTTINGATDVSGFLTTREGSVFKGSVNAPGVKAENTIFKGTVHASNVNAENTTFGDIFTRTDRNATYRFINSTIVNLYIEGLGNKIVILTNTKADSITFENPNGVVRLQGNSKVINVINGSIESPTTN